MLYSKVILSHNIILLSRPVDCCISFKTMNLEDVRQSTIISEACDGFEGEDDSRNSLVSCRHCGGGYCRDGTSFCKKDCE
jgi:hypothetical protein